MGCEHVRWMCAPYSCGSLKFVTETWKRVWLEILPPRLWLENIQKPASVVLRYE